MRKTTIYLYWKKELMLVQVKVFAALPISGFMKIHVAVVEIFMPKDGQMGGRSDGDFTLFSFQNLKAYKCNVLIVPLQTVFHVEFC